MMYAKQTIENFTEMTNELKKYFANELDKYGWKFNYNLEYFGDVQYFLITNKFSSVKLSYDMSTRYINRITINDVDVERILKLKEGL
ncbi:MAG TPA: hypothetical protein VNU45_09230 [Rummeliibacillus sp.]|nr:hypothetical protein [Rummeliibacillus sp.]